MAGAVGTDDDGLTDYERQRLAHVARNREYMARLGVLTLASALQGVEGGGGGIHGATKGSSSLKGGVSRKRARRVPGPPSDEDRVVRRSSRLRRIAPEHDGSAVDEMRDEEDTVGEKHHTRAGKIAAGSGGAGKGVWASEDAALEASRQWLEDARALMTMRTAAVPPKARGGQAPEPSPSKSWRAEAVKRWGDGVPAEAEVTNWETWVRSRVGTPPPPSDLQLLQEYYAHDAWQLLVACVLMSRVSSWDVKHNTISAFFAQYPTPTAALKAKPDEVLKVIKPLGLFPTRMRSIVEVSTKVLGDVGPLEVGSAPPAKIYGVGEFGIDSFDIFCRGDLTVVPSDKTLRSFVEWQRRQKNRR